MTDETEQILNERGVGKMKTETAMETVFMDQVLKEGNVVNEFGGNWKLVVFCALEYALRERSYVNYAIRDYILERKDKFESWELSRISELIFQELRGDDGVDRNFWASFRAKLGDFRYADGTLPK